MASLQVSTLPLPDPVPIPLSPVTSSISSVSPAFIGGLPECERCRLGVIAIDKIYTRKTSDHYLKCL